VGNFGLVHWHDHDQETNAKPSHGATSVEEIQVLACCLQRTAEAENDGANHDSQSPAEQVTAWPCKTGSEESATGEQRHHSTTFVFPLSARLMKMSGRSTYTWSLLGLNDAMKESEATLPPITPRSYLPQC
jgi:hypothetical protein